MTALMKVCSFEKAAGRKLDMLSECQSLIESLSASHSTDLQQRAYELKTIIGLDAIAMENIMPLDASCEDIEIDKSLSFLNSYIQKSLEEGAKPYLSEHERSGTRNISHFRNHDASTHSLRFEAYEVPKPIIPARLPPTASLTELAAVREQSYQREVHRSPSVGSLSDKGSQELRLRLDGVQKKWGRPTYSSAASPSTSDLDSHTAKGKSVEPFSRRQPEVEIPEEKQKLAASLFGGTTTSKSEKKPSQIKGSKATRYTAADQTTRDTTAVVHPPVVDLLDFGEPSGAPSSSTVDPFKQLEGLVDTSQEGNVSKDSDLLSLYSDAASTSGQNQNQESGIPSHGSGNASNRTTKGPNLKDALGKDALVRQMGVTPATQNPNLFKDLLG